MLRALLLLVPLFGWTLGVHVERDDRAHGKVKPSKASGSSRDAYAIDFSTIPNAGYLNLENPYGGLMPISGQSGEQRKLYFVYWPSSKEGGSNDLTVWCDGRDPRSSYLTSCRLNGGPGCSSMLGMIQEVGVRPRTP